jgi:hypothetical protein
MLLDREEYVEQAYLFRCLGDRIHQNAATQELLSSIREELLVTTKLPLAVDFLASELKLTGLLSTAMARLAHYFTSFQTYVVVQAEDPRAKLDFQIALAVLEREAAYRADGATPQGSFFYQFEVLCRNRLGYDRGLEAMAQDPIYPEAWKEWLLMVRRQLGIQELSDLVYVRSEHYAQSHGQTGADSPEKPVLFGVKEGRIALANRRKDPLWLFSALQRHLNYPLVPRLKPPDETRQVLPGILKRLDRLETRLKLLEEEQRGGIDITRFYGPASGEES